MARLSIATRHASDAHAWSLSVDGGVKSSIVPAALNDGTRVDVADLFYATPARLKFLKTDRTEAEAIREVVRRLGHGAARHRLHARGRGAHAGHLERGAAGSGRTPDAARRHSRRLISAASAIEVRAEREGVIVEGFAAAPSLTRANALGQYLFVNGRPVRDKLILGAVRAAYSDYLPRDRHPVVALFVTLDPREVDANVHPAKTEVRFRNAGLVRALIVHALKDGLAREGRRTAANSDGAIITSFRPQGLPRTDLPRTNWDWRNSPAYPTGPAPAPFRATPAMAQGLAEAAQAAFDVGAPSADVRPDDSCLSRPARSPAGCGAHADPRNLHRRRKPATG